MQNLQYLHVAIKKVIAEILLESAQSEELIPPHLHLDIEKSESGDQLESDPDASRHRICETHVSLLLPSKAAENGLPPETGIYDMGMP